MSIISNMGIVAICIIDIVGIISNMGFVGIVGIISNIRIIGIVCIIAGYCRYYKYCSN